jgi:hypothetical protein
MKHLLLVAIIAAGLSGCATHSAPYAFGRDLTSFGE